MKKTAIIVMMLILCTVASYAGVGYDSIVKFNERILELKLDLQKQLLMKKYQSNQVIGSFEVKGDTVFLKAYSIPLEGEKSFSISEVRDVNTFEVTKSSSTLPDVTKGSGVQETVAKGIALAGLLLLLGVAVTLFRSRKTTKQKKVMKQETKVEEKERMAA